MIRVGLLVLLAVFPPKPDGSLKFKDISITQLLGSMKLIGVKFELPTIGGMPIKIQGRIKTVQVEIRGQIVTAYANGFMIDGDPIRWFRAIYNRKNGEYYLKAEAFGGLVELEGKN